MNATLPLEGYTVACATRAPAALACARHLERMGAKPAPGVGHADVILTGDGVGQADAVRAGGDERAGVGQADAVRAGGDEGAGGQVRCVFERHELACGGLADSEATAQAAAGLTDYVGSAGGRAARVGCDIAEAAAGIFAAQAVLASLYAAGEGSPARVVRVSPLRALTTLKTILWAARARPDEWSGTHVRSRERFIDAGYRTGDGHITLDFAPGAEANWSAFVEELGVPPADVARLRARWWESVGWGDDVDQARPLYEECLGKLTSERAMALIRRHGGSSVPFLTRAQCLVHPQARAVGLSESLDGGLPWRMTVEPGPAAAPRDVGALPLAGVRIVDLGVGGVGPFSTALLAWLGADVVKVEAPNDFIMSVRPSVGGISTTYLALNQGKRSVTLDLKDRGDLALAGSLLRSADVIVDNFRPGVVERLSLGFEEVRRLNPTIIACSATGFGWTGPLAGEPCTDPHMQAFSGFAWLNAAEDEAAPRRIRYYAFVDLVTSAVIAEAVCAALLLRRRHGGAVRVETSMLHAVMEAQTLGLPAERAAPDGVYRAQDGFVALTCRNEDDWLRLVDLLGRPAALLDPAFGERAARAANSVLLREALEAILCDLPAAAWVHRLARAGVPCVRALRDEEVLSRRDFWELGMLRELPLGHASPLAAGGPPWDFQRRVPPPSAPLPGADTSDLRATPERFWRSEPAVRGASH